MISDARTPLAYEPELLNAIHAWARHERYEHPNADEPDTRPRCRCPILDHKGRRRRACRVPGTPAYEEQCQRAAHMRHVAANARKMRRAGV